MSGISKEPPIKNIPLLLKYHQFIPFENTTPIKGMLCYIIKHYGHNGLSLLVYRQNDGNVVVVCGDWNGNKLDIIAEPKTPIIELTNEFLKKDFIKLYEVMVYTKISQAQFFFGVEEHEGKSRLVLCDIQVALLKFASPGFVRDLFGNICRTQEVIKIEVIDDRAIEYINNGSGSYAGDIILKPTRFRIIERNGLPQPLYIEMLRG